MWLGANTARLHLLGVVEDLAHYSDRLVEVVRERHCCREDRPPLRGCVHDQAGSAQPRARSVFGRVRATSWVTRWR